MVQLLLQSRLKTALGLICIIFVSLGVHLFRLQISLTHNFFQLSKKNFTRYERIPSARGNILDAQGNLLVTNRPIICLYWNSTGNKKLSDHQLELVKLITESLALTHEMSDNIQLHERYNKKLLVGYDVAPEVLAKVVEKFPQHPNISIIQSFKRLYPHGSLASHAIGYLGVIAEELTGKMGLELVLNESLKGEAGQFIKTINSVGKQLAKHEMKRALTGDTIITTLHLPLQKIAEDLFPEGEAGTFILLDPQNGDIKVMLSRPTFDPSIFLESIDSASWQEMQERQGFLNKALSATYPPASLFKMITLAAALDQKIIDADTTWYCPGHITFGGRSIHCANRQGHGTVNAQEALAYSCNIPFYEIAKQLKIDVLAEYAKKFGLGEKTNILLPERAGLVPTTAWKRQTKGEQWWPGETLSAVIGQSYLLATPLQMALMLSAICEEYLVKPRILLTEEVVKKPLYINKSILQTLKSYMKQVITIGTGRNLRVLPEFEIYGKTGTAQTSDFSKRNLGKKYMEHGWFACYFSHKNQKPLTLIVLIEHIGSSKNATNLAFKFLQQYAKWNDIQAKNNQK